MARYTGPVCRLCRRAGEKLMLKGERCTTPKCAIERHNVPPGQHIARRRRQSDRGLLLREKQKARQIYGVLERQFRKHFAMAERRPGVTGQNLLQMLEMRLDNVAYRLGFSDSRNQARQVVHHGHINVNGRRVNIPSYSAKPGDVITWHPTSAKSELYQTVKATLRSKLIPPWLSLDMDSVVGRVLRPPVREEIDAKIIEQSIVDYYSR
ncbi:MAG: ribosomal protein [Dehalococcoidia bacterium]|nr:ribosomal protein [Dehalococcoidia bacterium]